MMPIIADAHAEKLPYPELSLYVLGLMLVVCLLAKLIQWITDGIWPKEAVKGNLCKPIIQTKTIAQSTDQLDTQLISVIAAAVYATLGDNTKIISIKTSPSNSWAEEGRRQQFQKKF